nr:MAG TPA: AbrB family transcriptional regulator-like protein [Caudoviricetes sp.]
MKSLLGITRRSDVIFRADGHFDLTARVVRALNISPGDVVDVLSDGCEYYLYVACQAEAAAGGHYEAQVYPSKPKGNALHFRGCSSRLCRAMLAACNAGKKAALPCGTVTTDSRGRLMLPIIVRLNLTQ